MTTAPGNIPGTTQAANDISTLKETSSVLTTVRHYISSTAEVSDVISTTTAGVPGDVNPSKDDTEELFVIAMASLGGLVAIGFLIGLIFVFVVFKKKKPQNNMILNKDEFQGVPPRARAPSALQYGALAGRIY